jgi:hypothetical protein
MKHIFLSVLGLAAVTFANSQTIVSTTPSNKNVVLEEYTGFKCVWCPDGHKVANEIKTNNPNRVVLINVHVGGFANPVGNEPDYRTPWGTGLLNQTGLTGYPAGTINRYFFGSATSTALGRNTWTANASTILGQASPVNIAVEASYNETTNNVEILVEAYFTDSQSVNFNMLNVAILQNNIAGPQTGGEDLYPEQILPNGLYRHMHMLRDLVTGQWGDTLANIGTGNFVSRTYTWSVPNDINGIPVIPTNLEVAAFIAENEQNILTGASTNVQMNPNVVFDLAVENQTADVEFCDNSVVPSIEITNESTTPITSFSISYTSSTGASGTENYSGTLNQGQSTTINFPAVSLAAGQTVIVFGTPQNVNGGGLYDINTINDIASAVNVVTVSQSVNDAPYLEGFESAAEYGFPAGVYGIDNGMARFGTISKSTFNVSQEMGGFGESSKSMYWFFWNTGAGADGSIVIDRINPKTLIDPSLNFDYAYTSYQGSNDRLKIEISSDCGTTFTSVWDKAGADLRTAPEVNNGSAGGFFKPTAAQWKAESIDLSTYKNEDELIVRFTGISDFGDNLYVDNINLGGTVVGLESKAKLESIGIYPNPSNGANTTLSLQLDKNAHVGVSIADMNGRIVAEQMNNTFNAGNNVIELNTQNLANGVYTVIVRVNETPSTQRLVIQK